MSRIPPSTRPDALRLALANLRRRVDSAATVAAETAVVTGWTDAIPRWIKLEVPYTLFTAAAATPASATVTTLPPGTIWTAARLDVGTNYVSTGPIWRMEVEVPTGGAAIGGTPKNPDVTTPDSLSLRSSDQQVFSDPAGTCDIVVTIDSGGDTSDLLTQGAVTVNLLVSTPGATTDDLPHA